MLDILTFFSKPPRLIVFLFLISNILDCSLPFNVDEDFDNNNEDGGGWSDLDNSEEEDSDLENSMNEEDDVDDDSEDDEMALQAELAKIR